MDRPRRVSPPLALAAAAAAFALLGIHARSHLPFISDDALISLRYARRLVQGHGLTWNTGEWVEGYSNLLWVLLSAALGWTGVELIDAVRLLGYACAGATLAALIYAHPPRDLRSLLPVAAALPFVALSVPFAVWTVGGMEQPLVAALLAWAVVLAYPLLGRREAGLGEVLAPGLFLALLCLTRLDGPLFTAGFVAALFLTQGFGRGVLAKAAWLSLLPLVCVALQQAFRVFYYGEWVPNTALVKFTPSGQHALDGWAYVRGGLRASAPLFLLAAGGAFVSLRDNFRRARAVLLVTLILAWLAYLVTIGGDIFPAWRHFVPLIVLCALLVAEGGEWAVRREDGRAAKWTTIALAAALLLYVPLQTRDSENRRAGSERWEWDGQVIGLLLKRAFAAEQPLMAVDPAGALPYWSELPALDMLGLNDHYLPRHPPPGFGRGPIAHELGDGRYVLDRRPDLVVFLLPTGAEHGYFLSGKQMQRDPRFFRDYTLVRFEGREPYRVVSQIWVRRFSERIGIRRNGDRVTIPGYLLNGHRETTARLDSNGHLVSTATEERPAVLKVLELPPGRWRISVEASGAPVHARVTPATAAQLAAAGDRARTDLDTSARSILDAATPATFDLDGRSVETRAVNVELRPGAGGEAEVRRLELTREGDGRP
jgi:arabinofuranosyltransferase